MTARLPRTGLEHALRDMARSAQGHASHHGALASADGYTAEARVRSRDYAEGMGRIARHLLMLADREDAGTLPPEAPARSAAA